MSHRENSLTPWITNDPASHAEPEPHIVEQPKPTWDGTRWSDDDPKTDAEKHAYCLRRWSYCATFLSPTMYQSAESRGLDMRLYVINKPMPTSKIVIEHPLPSSAQMRKSVTDKLARGERLGASHNSDSKPVVLMPGEYSFDGGITYKQLSPSIKQKWPCHDEPKSKNALGYPTDLTRRGQPVRKHITEKTCHGKDVVCLPGLNGQCTACFDDD